MADRKPYFIDRKAGLKMLGLDEEAATPDALREMEQQGGESLRASVARHVRKWLPTADSPATTIPLNDTEYAEAKRALGGELEAAE
jgi:hypothetical protein